MGFREEHRRRTSVRDQQDNLLNIIRRITTAIALGSRKLKQIALEKDFPENELYYQVIKQLADIHAIACDDPRAKNLLNAKLATDGPSKVTRDTIVEFACSISQMHKGLTEAADNIPRSSEPILAWLLQARPSRTSARHASNSTRAILPSSQEHRVDKVLAQPWIAAKLPAIAEAEAPRATNAENQRERSEAGKLAFDEYMADDQLLIELFQGRPVSQRSLFYLAGSVMCDLKDLESLNRVEQFTGDLHKRVKEKKTRLEQTAKWGPENQAGKRRESELRLHSLRDGAEEVE